MKLALKLSVLALASMAVASPAHADSYEEELAEMRAKFKAADKNGDGKLTKQEAKDGDMGRIARFFGRIDEDDDGFITLAQLEERLADKHDK